MKAWLFRSLGGVLMALALSSGLVAPASADPPVPPRATLLKIGKTVAYEGVTGGNYNRYKLAYPGAFDWSNNGCSVPAYIWVPSPVAMIYTKKVFVNACNRHDFGYRNFGNNPNGKVRLKLGPNAATKAAIDSQFLANMRQQCHISYSGKLRAPVRAQCLSVAQAFYVAVKYRGNKAFFG